jgi:hypothetical protein
MQQELDEIKNKLIEDEEKLPFFKRKTEGDASETGLIKFIQPLLMSEYGGDYDEGLNGIRK